LASAATRAAPASRTSASRAATKPATGPRSDYFRIPGVIRIFLAPHKNCVSDFKIADLRVLTFLPELGAPADLDGCHAPVLPGYFEGLVMHGRQFSKYSRTPLAAAPLRLGRACALRRTGLLRGRGFREIPSLRLGRRSQQTQ